LTISLASAPFQRNPEIEELLSAKELDDLTTLELEGTLELLEEVLTELEEAADFVELDETADFVELDETADFTELEETTAGFVFVELEDSTAGSVLAELLDSSTSAEPFTGVKPTPTRRKLLSSAQDSEKTIENSASSAFARRDSSSWTPATRV
jgi:hypothetical protein